ncbi:type II secretion system protein GspD [Burkholderia stagnalis]|uniref:type II secretion system protein GspD n=1 Tax=Burkholderia stagnalis TaxID=1503054 RepID=UPI0007565632|nr:type II secretory pathway protein [Burkholderia stagnalis]KVM85842.1 type II secretory pathway protein [Burkholderia stagnalis]KWK08403.1 type II secretory pathway protein [Burkholderia stagnalis]CAJ6828410.1 phage-related secreted protein [Burkholderia pseudomallei]
MTRYGVLIGVLMLSGACVAATGAVPPLPTVPIDASMMNSASPATPLPSVPVPIPLKHVRGAAFDLRFVTVAQVVDLIYQDAMHTPYVLGPDVLSDNRIVSFRLDDNNRDVRAVMVDFLDSLGFQVATKNGVDYVMKKPGAALPKAEQEVFVYKPRHRKADYLREMVEPLLGARSMLPVAPVVSAPVQAAGSVQVPGAVPVDASNGVQGRQQLVGGVQARGDELVIVGSRDEVAMLRKLVPELDTAPGEVVVRGWAYEVTNTDSTNTAWGIAAKVLGGQLRISSGDTSSDTSAVRFTGPGIDAAISALNADSRFKVISSPHVRIASGERVRLNVGQQVPTQSSVSYQGSSGTPVQSITYQDAGLIFDVEPTVMRDAIELRVHEEISDFVPTKTGVDTSPTKNTRQLQTVTRLKDGEVVVLGGLIQDRNTSARSGYAWLPSFLDGRSSSKQRTEVLLVLQVQRI